MRRVLDDLNAGMRFGNIVTVEKTKLDGRTGTYWKCLCDCGKEAVKYSGHIKAGYAKSCGCVKGAHRTHGMSRTPEYKAWDNARDRCRNPKNRKYRLYGARGIQFCERWSSDFRAFLTDMGKKPTKAHSLERVDGNGHYNPTNCIWATAVEQNNNRSINRHLIVDGKRLTVAQAARLTGVPHGTICSRLDRGVSDEEAIGHG